MLPEENKPHNSNNKMSIKTGSVIRKIKQASHPV